MGAVAVLGGRGRGVIGVHGPGRQLGAGPEAARGEWMAERKSARSRQERWHPTPGAEHQTIATWVADRVP